MWRDNEGEGEGLGLKFHVLRIGYSLDKHTKSSFHTECLYSLLRHCLVLVTIIYICLKVVKALLYMGKMMSNIIN
jgi:hypothetical protein